MGNVNFSLTDRMLGLIQNRLLTNQVHGALTGHGLTLKDTFFSNKAPQEERTVKKGFINLIN